MNRRRRDLAIEKTEHRPIGKIIRSLQTIAYLFAVFVFKSQIGDFEKIGLPELFDQLSLLW